MLARRNRVASLQEQSREKVLVGSEEKAEVYIRETSRAPQAFVFSPEYEVDGNDAAVEREAFSDPIAARRASLPLTGAARRDDPAPPVVSRRPPPRPAARALPLGNVPAYIERRKAEM